MDVDTTSFCIEDVDMEATESFFNVGVNNPLIYTKSLVNPTENLNPMSPLYIYLYSKIKNKTICDDILSDEVLCIYADRKISSSYNKDIAIENVILAREFYVKLKEIDPNIKSLNDVLILKNLNLISSAIKIIGEFDVKNYTYGHRDKVKQLIPTVELLCEISMSMNETKDLYHSKCILIRMFKTNGIFHNF